MERERKLLSDILNAIELIENFTLGINSFNDYILDIKTKSAVERQLAIVGEAVTKLKKESSISIENSTQLIAFRNRLIHAYDNIDDAIVWTIIKKHLPLLKSEVQNKLV